MGRMVAKREKRRRKEKLRKVSKWWLTPFFILFLACGIVVYFILILN
jgi:hypothetical protein